MEVWFLGVMNGIGGYGKFYWNVVRPQKRAGCAVSVEGQGRPVPEYEIRSALAPGTEEGVEIGTYVVKVFGVKQCQELRTMGVRVRVM